MRSSTSNLSYGIVLDDVLELSRADSWKIGLLTVEEISQVERRTRDLYVIDYLGNNVSTKTQGSAWQILRKIW